MGGYLAAVDHSLMYYNIVAIESYKGSDSGGWLATYFAPSGSAPETSNKHSSTLRHMIT